MVLPFTSIVEPGELFKGGVEPGDQLILTKPLGSGIVPALKGEIAPAICWRNDALDDDPQQALPSGS